MQTRFRALLAIPVVMTACGGSPTRPAPPIDALHLTCPADAAVRITSGTDEAVTYAGATATGGAAPLSVTCAPESGSLFSLGVTPVNCRATDAAAQTASCSFNVTVTGPTIAITRYLAFGDSVTEGQNGTNALGFAIIDAPNAYPTRLQKLFDLNYPGQGVVVVNRGRSGERVEDANVRLPGVLAEERPGVVMLLDGYNNLLNQCGFYVGVTPDCESTIEFVVGTLREAVRIARASSDVRYVFVGTLTPPGLVVSGPSDRRIAAAAISRVNAGIRRTMAGEGAIVVDLYPLFLGHEGDYIAADGLHLLAAGNQALADAFFAAIQQTVPIAPPAANAGRR